jgi:hypothetical protein
MSVNFANNYFFTLNRNYFGPAGYKFISYEALSTHAVEIIQNLKILSEEFFIIKKSNLNLDLKRFEMIVFLRYLSYKYYFAYYVYYMKSFYEFEPLNFKDTSNCLVFLTTVLAYTLVNNIKSYTIYDLNKTFDFFKYLGLLSTHTFFFTKPQLPVRKHYPNYAEEFYEKLAKLKIRYITAYKRLKVDTFFFHNLALNRLLVLRFKVAAYVSSTTY